MKFVANVTLSFISSANKKKLNKCMVIFLIRSTDCKICFAKNDNSKSIEYILSNNINEIRTKFITEGKITITLKSPDIYILISQAPVSVLENVVDLLGDIQENKNISEPKSKKTYDILTAADKELLQRTLTIEKVSQFPVTKTYPMNLEHLSLSGLKLKKFDVRILRLQSLSTLQLDRLLIEDLPVSIGQLHLASLTVSSCRLASWPDLSLNSPLSQSMQSLDLAGNVLEWLPEEFWLAVPQLRSLVLKDNSLKALPAIGMESMLYIRKLDLANNDLSILPYSFATMATRLTSCDLTAAFASVAVATLQPSIIPTKHRPFRPASLLHSSVVAVQSTVSINRPIAAYKPLLPRHIWQLIAVLRRCNLCHERVGPHAERSWSPLSSVANITFPKDLNIENPLVAYYCYRCVHIEDPMDH